MSNAADGAKPVFGPTGAPMTRDDLPPPTLKRWVTRRKAEVVMAVRAGVIDRDEACRRYGIAAENCCRGSACWTIMASRACAPPGCRTTAVRIRRTGRVAPVRRPPRRDAGILARRRCARPRRTPDNRRRNPVRGPLDTSWGLEYMTAARAAKNPWR